MSNSYYILFIKFPRPGDSEETFRSSNQAPTSPPTCLSHRVDAGRQAGKL